MRPPEISSSTKEEREKFIRDTMHCISNCENCGLCQIYKGKDPVLVYKDYIEGKRSYLEIANEYRR